MARLTALHRATGATARYSARSTTLAFPHPLRIWHFLPEINGAERAMANATGTSTGARQEAFIGMRRAIAGNVPAASAVGVRPGQPADDLLHRQHPRPGWRSRIRASAAPGPTRRSTARAARPSRAPASRATRRRRCSFPAPPASSATRARMRAMPRAQTREIVRNIRAAASARPMIASAASATARAPALQGLCAPGRAPAQRSSSELRVHSAPRRACCTCRPTSAGAICWSRSKRSASPEPL